MDDLDKNTDFVLPAEKHNQHESIDEEESEKDDEVYLEANIEQFAFGNLLSQQFFIGRTRKNKLALQMIGVVRNQQETSEFLQET